MESRSTIPCPAACCWPLSVPVPVCLCLCVCVSVYLCVCVSVCAGGLYVPWIPSPACTSCVAAFPSSSSNVQRLGRDRVWGADCCVICFGAGGAGAAHATAAVPRRAQYVRCPVLSVCSPFCVLIAVAPSAVHRGITTYEFLHGQRMQPPQQVQVQRSPETPSTAPEVELPARSNAPSTPSGNAAAPASAAPLAAHTGESAAFSGASAAGSSNEVLAQRRPEAV